MYKSEHAFSRAFCSALKKCKMHPVPIETGLTQQGVPDLFVMTGSDDVWIELKNMPYTSLNFKQYQIAWRPGQQAWHNIYYKKHNKNKFVYTLVALKDGFILIPMTKVYTDNIADEFKSFKTLEDVINVFRV